MPVTVETATSSALPADRDIIEIGLLNNLSDAGLEGGERQFIDLLAKAAGSRHVRLQLFSLPDIERGPLVQARIADIYTPFPFLFDSRLDGLIVTGCEPRATRLQDEPFWDRLTQVVDWAKRNTKSAIWSCLAAHAAVLHLDGIERRRLPKKASGLFAVTRAAPHALLDGAGASLAVPHSRYNDLAERDLVAAGYEILTRSPDVGVDAFVRQDHSLFVFLQGHPEYDADALYREYRRDVLRFLDGTSESYPAMPDHYLGRDTESALQAFALQACLHRNPALARSFPSRARRRTAAPWNDDCANTIFSNWLSALHATADEHVA